MLTSEKKPEEDSLVWSLFLVSVVVTTKFENLRGTVTKILLCSGQFCAKIIA